MEFGGNAKVKQRKIINPGKHVAICFSIIDLGTQKVKEFKTGNLVDKKQVELSFEFPLFRATYNEEKGPQIMAHFQRYTKSFFKSARLKETIQTWLGRKLENNEAFDMQTLLGRACHITLEQNPDNSGKKDDDTGKVILWQNMVGHPTELPIETVEKYETKIAQGHDKPFLRGKEGIYETENPKIYFDLQHFDQKVFDELSKFKRKMIADTPEFKALEAKGEATYSEEETAASDSFESVDDSDDDDLSAKF